MTSVGERKHAHDDEADEVTDDKVLLPPFLMTGLLYGCGVFLLAALLVASPAFEPV